MEISILQGGKYGIRFYPSHWLQQDGGEVPRFLFLGMCLVFHYPVVLGTFFVVSRRELGKHYVGRPEQLQNAKWFPSLETISAGSSEQTKWPGKGVRRAAEAPENAKKFPDAGRGNFIADRGKGMG